MRLLRTRFRVFCAAGAGAGALLAGGTLLAALTGQITVTTALTLLTGLALAAATGALGVVVRRLVHQVGRLRTNLDARARELTRRVETETAAARRDTTDLVTRALGELRAEQRTELGRLRKHVTRQGRHDYAQQVAWQELRDYLDTPALMPPLRGWAASPDVLRLMVETIRDRRPDLVVECGSGASSVWLGYALRRVGHGRLVALEHDQRYAELAANLAASHALSDIVEVRHAPLRDWTPEGGTLDTAPDPQPWYDLDAVADLTGIGLLFIDGPPGALAAQSRYPAGPVLFPRCVPDAVVVLDDAARDGERGASDRWLAADPDLRRVDADVEKGAHVLSWEKR